MRRCPAFPRSGAFLCSCVSPRALHVAFSGTLLTPKGPFTNVLIELNFDVRSRSAMRNRAVSTLSGEGVLGPLLSIEDEDRPVSVEMSPSKRYALPRHSRLRC
jgi:hypothetical protein